MKKFMKIKYLFILIIIFYSCDKDNSVNGPIDNPNDASSLTVQKLLDEFNYVRQNPKEYAAYLESLIPCYNGNIVTFPDEGTYNTKEGVTALNEAINVLKDQSPLNPCTLSEGLSKAAKFHCDDIGPKGLLQHEGSDGTDFFDRLLKYGTTNYAGENIAFGSKTAKSVIRNLIIDDGVSNRGHRKNILDSKFNNVGFGIGFHSIYDTMVVQDFAKNFIDK